ncbi:MAG: hypothetical protein QOE70_4336 [Chthoniobacter sp.]|jgi:hypothetical protein|nr:hypothetical protein [Chthoniobacter sp.]
MDETLATITWLKAELAEFRAAGIDGCSRSPSDRQAYLDRVGMLASYYDRWHREIEAA